MESMFFLAGYFSIVPCGPLYMRVWWPFQKNRTCIPFFGSGYAGLGDPRTDSRRPPGDGGGRQGVRHEGFLGRIPELTSDAARSAEHKQEWGQCHRRTDHSAHRMLDQPEETETYRRVFRVAQNDRGDAEGAASGHSQGRLGIHLRGGGVQPGADAKPAGQPGWCRMSQGISIPARGESEEKRAADTS